MIKFFLTCAFKSLVAPATFVSYKKLCIILNEIGFISTVLSEPQCSGSLLHIFSFHKVKENLKYLFFA